MPLTFSQTLWMIVALALALAGCHSGPSDQTVQRISEKPATPEQRVAEQRTVLPAGQPAASQQTFATPDDAVKALVQASEAKDHEQLRKLFGPAAKDFVSGDSVEDENDFQAFTDAASEHAALEERGGDTAVLHIGKDDWAFPIPIAKTKDGKWYFDTVAGETEILARRIGANELAAISLLRDYVDAQREYAAEDRDGSGVLKYAQRLRSSPDKHDGLYWPPSEGGEQSPFNQVIADAESEGYAAISGSRKNPTAYHGYYYHILKAQGPHAPAGAYDYVINGNMIGGFGMVAYPAEYGKSGIMTFIVSHHGKVFEADLGPNTAQIAGKLAQFDPDSSWKPVK